MTEPAPPTPAATPSPPPAAGTTQPEEATNILAASAAAGVPDSTGLDPDEEAELARLQAKAMDARQGGGTLELRIASGHQSVTYGNHTVTQNWTPTPAWLASTFASQAAESGVTIEQREEG